MKIFHGKFNYCFINGNLKRFNLLIVQCCHRQCNDNLIQPSLPMCAVVSEGESLEVGFLSHSSVSCCLMAFYRGCADFHSLKKVSVYP